MKTNNLLVTVSISLFLATVMVPLAYAVDVF